MSVAKKEGAAYEQGEARRRPRPTSARIRWPFRADGGDERDAFVMKMYLQLRCINGSSTVDVAR
jgi:hypothetical protein